jgi:hypothetical protein
MHEPSAPLPPLDQPTPPGAFEAPAALRNAKPILGALTEVLSGRSGTVLEIGSGSGMHAAAFAGPLAPLAWLPTDADSNNLLSVAAWRNAIPEDGIRPLEPRLLDAGDPARWPIDSTDTLTAIHAANMIHIAPWEATLGLFEGAARVLPADGLMMLYGPFKREGRFSGDGDLGLEDWLKGLDPRFGIRDLDTEIRPLARSHGFVRDREIALPANNMLVVFERG